MRLHFKAQGSISEERGNGEWCKQAQDDRKAEGNGAEAEGESEREEPLWDLEFVWKGNVRSLFH